MYNVQLDTVSVYHRKLKRMSTLNSQFSIVDRNKIKSNKTRGSVFGLLICHLTSLVLDTRLIYTHTACSIQNTKYKTYTDLVKALKFWQKSQQYFWRFGIRYLNVVKYFDVRQPNLQFFLLKMTALDTLF